MTAITGFPPKWRWFTRAHYLVWENLVLVAFLVLQSKGLQLQTWTLNFHADPTGTPGIGPKWFGGTIEHTFVRPTQAIPYTTQHDKERFRIAFMATPQHLWYKKHLHSEDMEFGT